MGALRNLQSIESPADPRIEPFRDVRDRDLRGRDARFLAESEAVVRRLLRTPERVEAVFVARSRLDALADALAELPASLPVYVAELDVMVQVAGFHIHRGVLAVGRRPARRETSLDALVAALHGRPRLALLVAEGITNVDNMGALFRNAAAFGIDGIVLDPRCCDPLYRKAIRVSMGHVLSTPWAVAERWPDDLLRLRTELGVRLVAAETAPDAVPVDRLPPVPRTAVLVGSEADGVTPSAIAACDDVAYVPMAPGVPSLNVAVAAAIMLHRLAPHEADAPCVVRSDGRAPSAAP